MEDVSRESRHVRTTHGNLDDDRFVEAFETRKPDGDWDCYITTELRRVPDRE